IDKSPEVRGHAFLKSIHPDNARLIRRLKLHPVHVETLAAIEQVQKLGQEAEWPQNVRDRAYDVSKPNYTYDVVFYMLSQLLHSNVAALASNLQLGRDEQFTIRIGRGSEWVDTALATVFIYVHEIARFAYKAFQLNDSGLATLGDRFKSYTQKNVAS